MCMRLFELTSYDLTGQAPCVVFGVLLAKGQKSTISINFR